VYGKAFRRVVVKEAEVTGNSVASPYTPPAIPETTDAKGGTLPTVHYGGQGWTRTSDLRFIRAMF
jgi:hypothetical protein